MASWHGFKRIDFEFHGHECILVCPHIPAEGRPWVWRSEFFGAFAQADEAMLRSGWHVAYVKLSDKYGCPDAVREMENFRVYLTAEYELCERAAIFGFSRGGLYAVNYALTYPNGVERLYLDAPVLDVRSWPAGWGAGIGGRREWEQCKTCYALTDETARDFSGNPLDRAEELARLNIPVLIVAGDADDVVPLSENSLPFEKKFSAAGGQIELIVKKGCGHHPHSLEDVAPIVKFLTEKRA